MKIVPTHFASFCLAALFAGVASPSLSSQDKPESAPPVIEKLTVAGRPAFVMYPSGRLRLDPTTRPSMPWVWYAPNLPGLPGKAEQWMFDQFLAAGVAIAGVDVGESYGSPNGRRVFDALHKLLIEERGMSRRPCLLARSRGGLMLYSWAAEHPELVSGIAGIYPVCNLTSYPGLKKAAGAYEMTEAELAKALPTHNPIDRLAPLAKASVPIFHIHGDTDRVVPLADNSAAVHDRYRKLGGEMTLQAIEGQGHNMWRGFFECQALVDFVIASARTTRGIVDIDRTAPPAHADHWIQPKASLLQPEKEGVDSKWHFDKGVLTASPAWDSVVTGHAYRDFHIYIQQRYELQILDSFGVSAKDYKASYGGSLYRLKKPDHLVNKPPGQWQRYDIVFRAPVFHGKTKTHNARITAYQNGQRIHDDYEIPRKTGAGQPEGPTNQPIKLQGHHNQVRFRNFWVHPLEPPNLWCVHPL